MQCKELQEIGEGADEAVKVEMQEKLAVTQQQFDAAIAKDNIVEIDQGDIITYLKRFWELNVLVLQSFQIHKIRMKYRFSLSL